MSLFDRGGDRGTEGFPRVRLATEIQTQPGSGSLRDFLGAREGEAARGGFGSVLYFLSTCRARVWCRARVLGQRLAGCERPAMPILGPQPAPTESETSWGQSPELSFHEPSGAAAGVDQQGPFGHRESLVLTAHFVDSQTEAPEVGPLVPGLSALASLRPVA